MHRPLVPRIHPKSTETQGNAAKIVFVDLNGWQHRPKPLAPQIRDFHVPVNSLVKKNAYFTKQSGAAFYRRLHDAVIRV